MARSRLILRNGTPGDWIYYSSDRTIAREPMMNPGNPFTFPLST